MVPLEIEILQKFHDKGSFDSETPLLDKYIRTQASQDVKRDLSVCYVLAGDNKKVLGYYTLSSNSIIRDELPEDLVKRLPLSYRDLPTILLGRLAVDKEQKGKRYGEILLMDALERSLRLGDQLGILAVVVDPIDEQATRFYKRYGFIVIPSNGKMFIPIDTLRKY